MYRWGLLIGGGAGPAQKTIAGFEEVRSPLDGSTVEPACSQCRAGLKGANEGKCASMSRQTTMNFYPEGAF